MKRLVRPGGESAELASAERGESPLTRQTDTHLVSRVAELLHERKAADVVVFDVRGRTSYADFIVVASGTSDRHVQSCAEHLLLELKKEGVSTLGVEGVASGQWALVDLGSVIAHVFHEFTRRVYDLDELWREAPKLELAAKAAATRAVR